MLPRRLSWLLKPLGRIRRKYQFYRECLRDSRAYFNSATVCGFADDHRAAQLESAVVRLTHVIEKGLCMPDFRPRSGAKSLEALLSILASSPQLRLLRREVIGPAKAVLEAYRAKHEALGIDVDDLVPPELAEACLAEGGGSSLGGIKPYEPVQDEDREAFFRAVYTRSSVRRFVPDVVPDRALVEESIRAAIQSPSVCNRQTWRAHAFTGALKTEVLELQNGNRGFGHTIPLVLVVTSDMRYFSGAEERYQSWIEGGFFAMSLLLAIHANGLGGIPLNWSVLDRTDQQLKRLTGIPEYERTIVVIGCGYVPSGSEVPISFRREVGEILRWPEDKDDPSQEGKTEATP